MQIQAAVVHEKGGSFVLQELTLDPPREDEVVVRLEGVGICHTDLVCRDQYFPVPLPCVFGHEGSGTVQAVGSKVTKVKPGDSVVLTFDSCGHCMPCRTGRPSYCHDLYGHNFSGGRVDGSSAWSRGEGRVNGHFFHQSSFGTHALARERNTVKVESKLPLHLLGPLGCGVQTGAGAIMNALSAPAGSSIAIFGCGTVGLSAVMGAAAVGCTTIIAIDVLAARLELARTLGATHVINSKNDDPIAAVRRLSGGAGVPYALECTGLPHVVRQAVDSLALTGIAGVLGVSPLGTEVALDLNAILFGRTVRGIIEGDSRPDSFMPALLDLQAQGRFPFERLIKTYPFKQINEAVHATERGEVVKAVLTF